ncbi:hypothetical protein HLB23_30710 [Nocardia uniformis]|uniref:Uncharacterized protein n=1 Tax=Nocardia uniformis TaxID=53432 RepID=A0A849CJ49_9NOCA|nr:hypothetical protein [Nocardia uniformis]NNH74171.1 hypothetical protein [Nocardia uniformis]
MIRSWLLVAGLNVEILRVENRPFGCELTYADAAVELFCHEALCASGGHFVLEGYVNIPPDEAMPLLRALVAQCRLRGLESEIDYVGVDADDNQLSAELTIRAAL